MIVVEFNPETHRDEDGEPWIEWASDLYWSALEWEESINIINGMPLPRGIDEDQARDAAITSLQTMMYGHMGGMYYTPVDKQWIRDRDWLAEDKAHDIEAVSREWLRYLNSITPAYQPPPLSLDHVLNDFRLMLAELAALRGVDCTLDAELKRHDAHSGKPRFELIYTATIYRNDQTPSP